MADKARARWLADLIREVVAEKLHRYIKDPRLGSRVTITDTRVTGDLREALLAARELLPLLEARGVDLRRHRGGALPLRVPAGLTAPVLSWVLTHVTPARLSFQVHSDPGTEEPRAICRDVLAEARRLGVTVPRLEAAETYVRAG